MHEDRESAESAGLELAKLIASKSPVAVQGSKVNLNYSRDHTVDEALEYAVSGCGQWVWSVGGVQGHHYYNTSFPSTVH